MASMSRNVATIIHPFGVTEKARLGVSSQHQDLRLGKFVRLQAVRHCKDAKVNTRTIVRAALETLETTDVALLEKSVNTIRFLAVDAVEKANSGHPGLPMGCALMGHILYDEVVKYNPKDPFWFNRDRFVFSAGHGCMLQYAFLHLAGYDSVQIEDLKQFRQWGSKTPGHPQNFETLGVTTSPLGQGVANAVGLALAEAHLAGRFNKPDAKVVDHYTKHIDLGAKLETDWNAALEAYTQKNPEEAAEFKQLTSLELPENWASALPVFTPDDAGDATRNLSQRCLNALARTLPGLIGGSADLASIGVDRFGASAPASVLYKEFGITVENLVATAKEVMAA